MTPRSVVRTLARVGGNGRSGVSGNGRTRALRLASADFDAFLEPRAPHPSRWTRGEAHAQGSSQQGAAAQRRVLRERIESWARGVLPRVAQLGLATEVVVPDEVEQQFSSRAPRAIAQRVLFVRDAYARGGVPRTEPILDPLRAHAYLALTIDSVHVEVSLEICPEAEADVKNLRARISDPTALLELTPLLESLPEEFAIGVIGVPSFPRAQSATAEDIRALLDDSQRNGRPLWMGWSIKREVALTHSEDLDEHLEDALVALAHAYRLVAWADDNDLVGAGRRGTWRAGRARAEERRERGREERRKRRKGVRKGRVRKEGSRREREDARRLVTVDREAPASRASGREDARERTDERGERPCPSPRPAPLRRPILPTSLRARGAPTAATDVDPSVPIDKGTRVRVLAGPFANKVGIVQELDGQGRARVRLGLLAATLDLKELVASAGGSRPMLASSHRRPRNARGR